MAESTNKVIIDIVAKDSTGPGVDKAVASVEKKFDKASQRRSSSASADTGRVYGPAVRDRFDSQEQAVRDTIAGRIRAMRDQAQRSQVSDEANKRLYGEPLRKVNRTASEQNDRDQRAALLRDLRDPLSDLGMRKSRAGFGGGRGSSGGGGGGGGGEGSGGGGLFGKIKDLGKQSGDLGKLLKLGGALAIADQIGQALQGVPEAAEKFRQGLKNGGSKSELFASSLADALPGIGSLAKGFQAAGQAIEEAITGAEGRRKRKEEDKATRDAIKSNRDAKRGAITSESDQLAQDAGRTLEDAAAAALTGKRRGEEQARLAYERELEAINKDNGKTAGLTTEQQDQFKANQEKRRQAAAAKYTQDLAATAETEKQRRVGVEREQEDAVDAIREAGARRRLEQAGNETELQVAEIEQRRDAELKAVRRGVEDVTREYGQGSAEAIEAERLAGERRAALAQDSAEAVAEIRRKAREAEADEERNHQENITQAEAQIAGIRLQAAGRGAEAEKLALKEQLREKLAAIQASAEEQLKKAGGDAAKKAEIERRAAEDAAAATGVYEANADAINNRRGGLEINRGAAGGQSRLGARLTRQEVQTSIGGAAPNEKLEKAIKESSKRTDETLKGLARAFGEQLRTELERIFARP
jgi:hypothetical protein